MDFVRLCVWETQVDKGRQCVHVNMKSKNEWVHVLNCGWAVLYFNQFDSRGLTNRSPLIHLDNLNCLTKVVSLWLGIHLFFQSMGEGF